MSKILLTLSFFIILTFNAQAESTNISVVPWVKDTLVSYVVRSGELKDAYSKLKTLSLDAVHFIQSNGKSSTVELDDLVSVVSRQLERESVFLNKEQIVATIISAINS